MAYEALPTGRDLLNYWIGQSAMPVQPRLLQVLANVYPNGLARDEVARIAELSPASGTFATYLGKVRTLAG